jgi:hypothetical protein
MARGVFLGKDISSARGASVRVPLVGLPALLTAFAMLPGKARKGLAEGMEFEMQHVIDDSKENWVPVDTAALKDSGFASDAEIKGDTISVTGGFGPALLERRARGGQSGSEHTLPVHEVPANHQQGSDKYLELPWLIHQIHMLENISRVAWSRVSS